MPVPNILPLISRNAPAFALTQATSPSNANDADLNTTWRSSTFPTWLAYDLSGHPSSARQTVLLVWYNETFGYDQAQNNFTQYGVPQTYTVETNAGAGGGSPPGSGWTTRVTVSGNTLHSKQHILTMGGDNWIRLNVTGIMGTTFHMEVECNMDVFDASRPIQDDWIFYGDSITANGVDHAVHGTTPSLQQLVVAQRSDHWIVQENAGEPTKTSQYGASVVPTYITSFPGIYATLNYGTNDANNTSSVDANAFQSNYTTMINAVINHGCIPVIPTIPWGRTANLQTNVPTLNTVIRNLYTLFPQIIPGPDLYAYFNANQSLISGDGIHPLDPSGYQAYRTLWANMMIAGVYTPSSNFPHYHHSIGRFI